MTARTVIKCVVILKILRGRDNATYVNGKLDELRIYDRSLTEAEVQELYQNP